ncbi:hypothetical protein BpHYR1_041468 [Brachionus plicatilis]|uniref:Uncharacterized protein n=1 Tax=Brachionus plicatilis TaxID=10195 RepID=A0A3M7S2N6_BRAPC|nr:hypothetical protein BpHYR1_041468 [Brachionus plicatilis]
MKISHPENQKLFFQEPDQFVPFLSKKRIISKFYKKLSNFTLNSFENFLLSVQIRDLVVVLKYRFLVKDYEKTSQKDKKIISDKKCVSFYLSAK